MQLITIKNNAMKRLLPVILLLLVAIIVHGQQKLVKGVILNGATNAPVPGVTISSGNQSAMTDSAGFFSIKAMIGENVNVSHVGMKSISIKVGSSDNVTIKMEEISAKLEEVVVTGYQTQRKADLTGAISVVSMKEVRDIPSGNPMQS